MNFIRPSTTSETYEPEELVEAAVEEQPTQNFHTELIEEQQDIEHVASENESTDFMANDQYENPTADNGA